MRTELRDVIGILIISEVFLKYMWISDYESG